MPCFKSLIFMSLSTVLLTAGDLAVADEQPLKETPAALTASVEYSERDSETTPMDAATERPAMTEQDVRDMVEGEVLTNLGMRLASSAPQS